MSEQIRLTEAERDDGPECEICGKTSCPDAQLPGFSEPVDCEFAPVYEELRAAKDCDYGCGRDFTNQELRLWLVPAVERIVAGRVAQAAADERARIVWWLRTGVEGPAAVSTESAYLLAVADLANVIENHPERFAQAPAHREASDA